MDDCTIKRMLRWASEDRQRAIIGESVLVDTDFLFNFRAVDRLKYPSSTNYDDLKADISKNGISSPVILDINFKTGFASLVEGNHRISIAKELNIDKVLVNICINNKINNNDKIYKNGKFLKNTTKIIELIAGDSNMINPNIDKESFECAFEF